MGEKISTLSPKLSIKEGATGEGGRDATQVRSWVISRPLVEFPLGTTVGENVGNIMRIASGQLVTSDYLPFMMP